MPKAYDSTTFNKFHHARRNYLKQKGLKTGDFAEAPESALGAGGRKFESRRPDQHKQLIYLQCRVSARLARL
jgi:hypothetical protein